MTTPSAASEELRYPIGRFHAGAVTSSRAEHIDTLRQLPSRLRAAVEGLTGAQLDTPYREGGWTVRQLVHHIADSHSNALIRIKLALTEDAPTVKPYDEAAWARLADSRLPIAPSLGILDGVHARFVALLEPLAEAGFARVFVHPENGTATVAGALAHYAWHSRHHLAHITNLRQRMGW